MRLRWTNGRSTGVPEFPRAWIIQTARHKAIDRIRRKAVFEQKMEAYVASGELRTFEEPNYDYQRNSRRPPAAHLYLLPSRVSPWKSQVALTLRTLCGLETDEIARAFLVPPPPWLSAWCAPSARFAMPLSRIVVPETKDMARLEAVLAVIYLVFNEGYAATRGSLMRTDLCAEAIRLGRLYSHVDGAAAARRSDGITGPDAAARCPSRRAYG